MRGLRSGVAGCGGLAALLAVSGCGASSAPTRTTSPARAPAQRSAAGAGPSAVDGVSVRSVERALLANGTTTAACRAASAAERSAAPFGPTALPLFTCELTVSGERATYVVQVLHNGCFVAERRRLGRAVYGCGADRS